MYASTSAHTQPHAHNMHMHADRHMYGHRNIHRHTCINVGTNHRSECRLRRCTILMTVFIHNTMWNFGLGCL